MSDLDHSMGADLAIGPTGDLQTVAGTDAVRERVLRRLLTNTGDYVWSPEYGAGLASFVGQVAMPPTIEAVIRAQMLLEASVARVPPPVVEIGTDNGGTVSATVTFADSDTSVSTRATVRIGGG